MRLQHTGEAREIARGVPDGEDGGHRELYEMCGRKNS
jgi:hypothetical protein